MRDHRTISKTDGTGTLCEVRVSRHEFAEFREPVRLSAAAKAKRDARKKQAKASRKANR